MSPFSFFRNSCCLYYFGRPTYHGMTVYCNVLASSLLCVVAPQQGIKTLLSYAYYINQIMDDIKA